jgi:hypothetical protein
MAPENFDQPEKVPEELDANGSFENHDEEKVTKEEQIEREVADEIEDKILDVLVEEQESHEIADLQIHRPAENEFDENLVSGNGERRHFVDETEAEKASDERFNEEKFNEGPML